MVIPAPGRHDQRLDAAWCRDPRWWGRTQPPEPVLSLPDLLDRGVMSPNVAVLLETIIERRIALTVIGREAGAGKTTLLTALLAKLPSAVTPVVLRGRYEPFDFVGDPARLPAETALLINEISPHWPFYLWGPAVAKALRLTRRGYATYATAHAASPAELIAMLAAEPLRVPMRDIASLGVIVVLGRQRMSTGPPDNLHRVTSCHGLALAPDGQSTEQFALACPGRAGEAISQPAVVTAWEQRNRLGPLNP